MDQDSFDHFPCCGGQKEPPEKSLSWWWLWRGCGQGADGASNQEPHRAVGLGRAQWTFPPSCPTASPGTRLLHTRCTRQKLSNSVCVCGKTHKSQICFRKKSKTGAAKAGNQFVFYCHDRGRGPDQLEKLGLPTWQKISTNYLVSGRKSKKAANQVKFIRIKKPKMPLVPVT